jgi:hypothetical protein
MKKELAKRNILGGCIKVGKNHKNYEKSRKIKTPKKTKETLKNAMTGREVSVVMNRQGTTEKQLGLILNSTKHTKDQKDSALANYLYERGLESSSFLADLFRSKGAHTKETRVFKTQVRFDLERMIQMVVTFYRDTAKTMFIVMKEHIMDYAIPNTVELFYKDLLKYYKVNEGSNMESYFKSHGVNFLTPSDISIFALILQYYSEADLLEENNIRITEARMREKGYGVYVDKHGKAYSIFDEDIEKIIREEKEEIEKVVKSDDNKIQD